MQDDSLQDLTLTPCVAAVVLHALDVGGESLRSPLPRSAPQICTLPRRARACMRACVRALSGQHEARVERARNLKRAYLYLYIQARAVWLMQTARIDQTR